MHPVTQNALFDELEKIASEPAREANNLVGLPIKARGIPRKREYDQGSAAAASPDRSQSPVGGQSSANISAGNTMSPAAGPGGV